MLKIVLSAMLIAVGVIAVYFIDKTQGDTKAMTILLLGIGCIIGGGWLFVTTVGIGTILTKIIGLVMIGFGVFMIIGFPGVVGEYQSEIQSKFGILVGMIAFIIGAYLLFF